MCNVVLVKYFILFATAAIITDIVSFFISIETIVKEKNFFNTSPMPQCLCLPNLAE